MKKLCLLFITAFAVSFLFIACDSGSDATSLKWVRADGDSATFSEIQWKQAGVTDQTWTGSYKTGDSTDSKEVTKLTGNGEGLEDGQAYQLFVDTGSGSTISVTLTEKSDNTLTINQIQTK